MNENFSQLFPDKREENVDKTILRQAQLIMLRNLKIVDYICKKHNISYWLDSGTLLGAVRHNGFIPWDDDIDIAMPRKDYYRFIEIARNELPEDLYMQNLEVTKLATNTWTQIKDRKSMISVKGQENCHKGLYIDIFPMDSYSDNSLKKIFCEKIFKLLYINVQAINAPLKRPYFKGVNLIKNMIRFALKIVFFGFAIFNYEKIYELNIKTREKRIGKMMQNPKTNCGYGTDVLNWDKVYKAESIFPLKHLKFEDGEFYVPNDFDAVLKILYGSNYMELPPENKRVFHNLSIKPILNSEELEQNNNGFDHKLVRGELVYEQRGFRDLPR